MAVIHLVRHGQASFAAREYDKLSPLGSRQSRILGTVLRQRLPRVDRVVSGSMRRHRETAADCLAAFGDERQPDVDRRWDEFDHTDVLVRHKPAYRSRTLMTADLARTGAPGRTFQAVFDAALLKWTAAGGDGRYAETWPAFSERVCAALTDLASDLGRSGTALVFTSGGAISAVAAKLLGTGADVWLQLNRVTVNTGITKVVRGRRGTTLVSFNDHSHVDGDLLTYR